jgi:hypothetical protein
VRPEVRLSRLWHAQAAVCDQHLAERDHEVASRSRHQSVSGRPGTSARQRSSRPAASPAAHTGHLTQNVAYAILFKIWLRERGGHERRTRTRFRIGPS